MLVHAQAHKQREEVHVPFVLCKEARYAYVLFHVTLVACHYIMQLVLLVFYTACEYRWREEAVVYLSCICGAGNPCQVIGLAVCVGVTLCTVIAVAVDVLHRCKERQLVLVASPTLVICHAAAVDDVLGLLGDVALVWLKVELVSAAAQLVGVYDGR